MYLLGDKLQMHGLSNILAIPQSNTPIGASTLAAAPRSRSWKRQPADLHLWTLLSASQMQGP